jgi:streptogramin lyase
MRLRLLAHALGALACAASALPAAAETAPVLAEFPTGLASAPGVPITGADGNLWFADEGCSICTPAMPPAIGRITPAGAITEFSQGLAADSFLQAMTLGPDGNIWFTVGSGSPAIGRITPDGAITEFTQGLSADSFPLFITSGPDGNIWFTDQGHAGAMAAIGRITPAGIITEFSEGLTAGLTPWSIVRGPDGNLWFADNGNNNVSDIASVGRITPAGVIAEFPLAPGSPITGLTVGPDGNLWVAGGNGGNGGAIARVTPDGTVTEFTQGLGGPTEIVAGPDGNLWFTDLGAGNAIGRITPAGAITEFTQGIVGDADSIAAGPDGNLWFTDQNANAIGRITTDGVVTEFPDSVPANSQPFGITVGPDGNLWYASQQFFGAVPYIGRVTLPGTGTSDVALVASVLPASRSVAFGSAANVFATVINTSTDTAGTSCSIEPVTKLPAIFRFQTTDPQANTLTGTLDAPVTIPPGAAQSFVLAFEPYQREVPVEGGLQPQDLLPTIVDFNFACANAPAAAPIVTGVNTLLLSASAQPTPDIVALAATPGNQGIVTIASGVGAFAVATVNLGAPGAMTVSANLGGAALPVTLGLCQTIPATGVCMASPAGSVGTSIDANATPTFAIFLQASGTIPFLPATNRVFVQFEDAGNAIRGQTSVAVQTQ